MLTIKQIENKIERVALDYIKDHSYENEIVRSTPELIETTSTGAKYICKSYNKRVFNKEKYENLVREYYLNSVQEEEVKKKNKQRKRPEKGKNITVKEFLTTLFRENFEHRKGDKDKLGRRIQMNVFTMNFDKKARLLTDKKAVKTMDKLLQATKKYKYFTPNMFIDHRFFTKEVLALLGVIILDFDLDERKVVMTKNELRLFVKKKLGVELSMIWDTPTKGNYGGAILLKKMAGTPLSVHLYEQIVKEMVGKLEGLADVACSNANHVFVMPQNNPKIGKIVRKYNEEVHSINEFRWLLNERDERRKRENKIIDFRMKSFRKEPAVAALFNGEVTYRDHAAFTLALVMRWMKYDEVECGNYMHSKWLPNVQNGHGHAFTERELDKCIRHAYSGKYRNFKSTWIEICTGIECNLNGYFMWRTYENKGIYIMDTETRLREFFKKNGGKFEGKIEEIAQELNVSLRSLKRYMATLRDNNELVYQTKRGRGAKTTFYYTEPQQLEFDSVLQFETHNYDDEIAYLNELDKHLEELSS